MLIKGPNKFHIALGERMADCFHNFIKFLITAFQCELKTKIWLIASKKLLKSNGTPPSLTIIENNAFQVAYDLMGMTRVI
jgi:hypothetical protein